MHVHATLLASELRRRRVGAGSIVSALDSVNESTYVLGDLRDAPTSLLVLAAMSLTSGRHPIQLSFDQVITVAVVRQLFQVFYRNELRGRHTMSSVLGFGWRMHAAARESYTEMHQVACGFQRRLSRSPST